MIYKVYQVVKANVTKDFMIEPLVIDQYYFSAFIINY